MLHGVVLNGLQRFTAMKNRDKVQQCFRLYADFFEKHNASVLLRDPICMAGVVGSLDFCYNL
jgi:hypothetical protein